MLADAGAAAGGLRTGPRALGAGPGGRRIQADRHRCRDDGGRYIRLEDESGDVWLATLPVWVSPGDVIEFGAGAVMKDFHSETLGRTFDSILFVENVVIAGQKPAQPVAAAEDPHQGLNMAHPGMQTQAAPAPTAVEALEGGMTIEQVFAAYPDLDGQTVQLRAQVVKVNPNIMGMTWVTLQDGTGAAPDDTLTVTTNDSVAVGDTVEVTGVCQTDVDLGYGYAYKLLLQEARLTSVDAG
jgi:hypothetical protein